MGNVITPDVTIYLYADEVSDTADYTVTQDGNDQYLQSLPMGKYFFKVEGTYSGTPIAEEYKAFTIYENKIVDWNGTEWDRDSQTIQEFIFNCYLAISTLTIEVVSDGSAYTGSTVKVGEDNDTHTSREAVETGTAGTHTIDNIKTNDNILITAEPDSADTGLRTETKIVEIGNSNKTVEIELYYHYYLRVISVDSNTGNRVYPSSGYITTSEYSSNSTEPPSSEMIVTELSKDGTVLKTNDKLINGIYKIYIDNSAITGNIYETYIAEIELDQSTGDTIDKTASLVAETSTAGGDETSTR